VAFHDRGDKARDLLVRGTSQEVDIAAPVGQGRYGQTFVDLMQIDVPTPAGP